MMTTKPAELVPFPIPSQEFPSAKLTPRQTVALAALVSGATLTRAAAKAHVTRRTIYKWTKTPAFAAALARARDEAFRDALDDLRRVTGKAVRVAEKLMSPKSTPEVQLGACRVVLVLALKVSDAVHWEQRLANIEARLGIGESA